MTTDRAAATRQTGAAALAVEGAAVFLLSLAAFIALRTSDFLAVDGGMRALHVQREAGLHAANHLLYPFNIRVWVRLFELIGLAPDGPMAVLHVAQAMNATAAAGVVALLYVGARAMTSSLLVAGLTAGGFALSRAFLAHATSGAEPMVGFFWSVAATALAAAGIAQGRAVLCLLGGALFALALATYQSMAGLVPAVAVLIWRWPRAEHARRGAFGDLAIYGAGIALGTVAVYAPAYYFSGTRDVVGMVARFFHLEGNAAYGGVTAMKAAAVLPGLAYAMFPCLPAGCAGFRCLLVGASPVALVIAALATLLAVAWVALTVRLAVGLWRVMNGQARAVLTAAAVGLGLTSLPLLYWLPTYDKLWLQPLFCLFVAFAVVAGVALPSRAPSHAGLRRTATIGLLILGAVALWNAPDAAATHVRPAPYWREAEEVRRRIQPNDLLVGDWGDVFILYQALWGLEHTFNVATDSQRVDRGTLTRLDAAIARSRDAGGQVYFLGVLDTSRDRWRDAPPGALGVPYEELDRYRCCTEVVASLESPTVTTRLYRLQPPAPRALGDDAEHHAVGRHGLPAPQIL